MQVDPIKPKSKPPGTGRLQLKRDILLSTSAFNFKLRRYIQEAEAVEQLPDAAAADADAEVGAYTRPLFSST